MATATTSVDSGTVLADRWVLGERIGRGATSRVYLATDRKLRIRVAVKVLSESLAADARFLEQFALEARAVSSLEHDHIVRFFDSGTQDVDGLAVPWIVTAYMPGGSLASLLAAGRRLDVAAAASVGAQAADALAHAHAAGLVHRDVKPSNLLFDEQGRLHLSDFGIARAVAAASVTEPLGSLSGTTRYASPEQLQGAPVDGRSDVYSLGLVLVESVTGMVPHLADSLAGTAEVRTQRDVDVSGDFGALRTPLLAATAVDPDRRRNAAQLAGELRAVVEELGDPGELPLAPPRSAAEDTSEMSLSPSPPGVGPGAAAAGAGAAARGAEALAGSGLRIIGPVDDDGELRDVGHVGSGAAGPGPPGTRPPVSHPPEADDRRDIPGPQAAGSLQAEGPDAPGTAGATPARPGPRRARAALAVALAVLVAAAAAFTGWWFLVRVPTHEVPEWIGGDLAATRAAVEDFGWELEDPVSTRRDGTVAGQVLDQDPPAGTELAEGEPVRLTVSAGPTLTALPAVSGMPEAEAVVALEGAGLVPGERLTTNNEDFDAGVVLIAQPAEGSETPDDQGRVPKGTAVDLLVSDGPAPRVVPDGLVGASRSAAVAALEEIQLVPQVTEQYSDTVVRGVVVSSAVAPGTELPRGSTVGLVVSAGPQPIVVPDVSGLSGSEAASVLEAAGFTVSGIEGSPTGAVIATDPVAGESRQPGAAVRIFTRR